MLTDCFTDVVCSFSIEDALTWILERDGDESLTNPITAEEIMSILKERYGAASAADEEQAGIHG